MEDLRPAVRILLRAAVSGHGADGAVSKEDTEALERAHAVLRRIQNPIGKVLARSDVAFSWTELAGGMLTQLFEIRAAREGARAARALLFHERAHGELPDDLGDLVDGGFLAEVPVDPFTGDRLRYSRERRALWSVGPDGRDDGGKDDFEAPRDFVWILPSL